MCLEFSKVENELLHHFYSYYSKGIPFIGKYIVGNSKPYKYLIESIEKFPSQIEFKNMIEEQGFEDVQFRNLSNGIAGDSLWMENLDVYKIISSYKIGRKLAVSGAIDTVNEIYNLPFFIKNFFKILSIGSSKKYIFKKPGEKLCIALEGMGTTFIKLGQFLATRPDIIGEELADDDLAKLQDKLPAFQTSDAKRIIKKILS